MPEKKPTKKADLILQEHRGVNLTHLKEPFLIELRKRVYVTQAAEAVGLSRQTIYEWRKTDIDFARRMDEVDAATLDVLRSEAFRRAVVGNEEPMSINGQVVMVKRYSDYLLDRLLRSKDPAFKDNLRVDIHLNFVNMLVAKLQQIVQRVAPLVCPHCKKSLEVRKDLSHEFALLGDMDVAATIQETQ